MRVLVTGGSGYLGSILCEHLLDAGHRVTVVDSLIYRQHSLFGFCGHPQFEFVFGDVRNEDLMRGLVQGADVIIPLAAVVGAPACDRDPWLARSVNLEAIKMLNRLRSAEQLVVYPTTNSGYGAETAADGGIAPDYVVEDLLEAARVAGRIIASDKRALTDEAKC